MDSPDNMNRTHGVTHYNPDWCYGCKILTVQIGIPAFTPHYNYAVGHWVTSWQDFNDRMKRKGEEAGADYEPLHPADVRANPPPESAPSRLPRLVAHDENNHPMHDPVDIDPTILPARRTAEWDRQRARALLESETENLIDDGD